MRWLLILALLTSCASVRSSSIFSLTFSDKPPRAAIRAQCNGKNFTTQGVVVCEQKGNSKADISVKVPPLEGRVVYSNGQLKKADDFNYGVWKGFWIFRHKVLPDTWAPLDLGEIAATFGDWPVSLDIAANDPDVGVIVTRGILYYRICDDKTVPCSRLEASYDCAGSVVKLTEGEIGKCLRLAGSNQDILINLHGSSYQVREGAKLYISEPRIGYNVAIDVTPAELAAGAKAISLPTVQTGPALVGLRLAWYEGATMVSVETRILLVGFSPDWTGLDEPHYLVDGDSVNWLKPFLADVMEVDTFNGQTTVDRDYGRDQLRTKPKAGTTGPVCAFAWERDASDLSVTCLDYSNKEVKVP